MWAYGHSATRGRPVTDERTNERQTPDPDHPQPGTVYQCPHCDFGTLDFQRLREHWTEEHAAEHGLFSQADIDVEEGP